MVLGNRWSVQSKHSGSTDLHLDDVGLLHFSIGTGQHYWIDLIIFMKLNSHSFQFLKNVDLTFLVFVMRITIGLVTLFLYCYYGKLATGSFGNMAVCLFECNWVDLPIGTQKNIWLMMANAQKSVFYHGFGIAILNLETFRKVRTLQMTILIALRFIVSFQLCISATSIDFKLLYGVQNINKLKIRK